MIGNDMEEFKQKFAVLVVSCDKYSDLWDPFFSLFEKVSSRVKSPAGFTLVTRGFMVSHLNGNYCHILSAILQFVKIFPVSCFFLLTVYFILINLSLRLSVLTRSCGRAVVQSCSRLAFSFFCLFFTFAFRL